MKQSRAKAQETLARWHEMAASRDLSKVGEIAREDVVFRSPVAHTPYHGREALTLVLSTVIKVFENFTYHRQFVSQDGMSVALEFSAEVGGKELKGADFIRFDEDGLIAEFEVMIRPVSGLMALGQAMGARLEGKIGAFRQGSQGGVMIGSQSADVAGVVSLRSTAPE